MTDESGPPPLDLTRTPWSAVLDRIRARLARDGRVDLLVRDPDADPGRWRGEAAEGEPPHLGVRDWIDLAEGLSARLRTPRPDVGATPRTVLLTLDRLGDEADLHGRDPHRYARDGAFARVRKSALPGFLLPLSDALRFARGDEPDAAGCERVLVVGCHHGDELAVLGASEPPVHPRQVVGIDVREDALAIARERWPDAAFLGADAGDLPADLGRFELIVAIAVLQSPELDGPAVLRSLVRDHATPAGGLVIGLPASRFRDGEVLWGARTRNFTQPDLSLVVRDLAGHRRYLHQHGYRTRIGGRYDLLLAARRAQSGQDVIMPA